MEQEIADIFNELQQTDNSYAKEHLFPIESDDTDMHIVNTSQRDIESGRIDSLGEVFLEWYLFDPNSQKSIENFLQTEDLTNIFTEQQFMDLLCGKAYLDDALVKFVLLKLPFPLSFNKLGYLNSHVKNGYLIESDYHTIIDKIRVQIQKINQTRKTDRKNKRRIYVQKNREHIRQKKREYNARNRERVNQQKREYWSKNREKYLENHKKWVREHPEYERKRAQKPQRKKYMQEYHKRYAEKNREAVQKQKKAWYEANKAKCAEQQQARLQNLKQQAESAQKICAAYVFLLVLRKTNKEQYLQLYTRQQNPLIGMLKICPALQSMDINMCPLCNPDCDNNVCECCNQKVLSLPKALSELQIIANKLKQR